MNKSYAGGDATLAKDIWGGSMNTLHTWDGHGNPKVVPISNDASYNTQDMGAYWDRAGTLTIDANMPAKMCPYCSGTYSYISHSGVCPKVSAIEYYTDGSVKRVEFRKSGDSL